MTTTVPVTARDEAVTGASLRANGAIPAVVYGPKQAATAISLDAKVFDKVRKEVGESTVIQLSGLAAPVEALIKEVSFDPVKQQVLHVDFYAVEQGKEMTAHVALEYVGEAPVELSREGSVTHVLQDVTVICKPSDLPAHLTVDLSQLVAVEDKILIEDLVLPSGVRIDVEPDEPVAVVSAAKQETVEEPEAAEVDMSAIAVEKKGKEEETEEA